MNTTCSGSAATTDHPRTMPTSRLRHLDVAKGIAVSGIVLVHADAVLPGRPTPGIGAAASVALAVLFLVSGRLAGARLVDPAARRRSVLERIVPLLWLYVLWQPAVLLQRVLLTAVDGGPVDVVGELARLVASPLRPNGELWYLWALALHLVLVAATRRLPTVVVLVPAAVLFVLCNGFGAALVGGTAWHVAGPGLQGLPQFAFWTLLGARCPALLSPVARPRRRLTLVGVAVIAIGTWSLVSGPQLWHRPVQAVAGVVAVLAVSELFSGTRGAAPVALVGRWSIVPYLTHMTVLTLTVATLVASGWDAPTSGSRTVVLAVVVALAVGAPVLVFRCVQQTWIRWLFTAPPGIVERIGRPRSRRDARCAPGASE